jgi:predicted metalloprotease with PDZ domain
MTRSLNCLLSLLLAGGILGGCASTTRTSAGSGAASNASISYAVSIPDLAKEAFRVEATLENIPADTLTFNFPIWAPGAYDLVYFGRYVKDLKATDSEGGALEVIRSDSNMARIVGAGPRTTLRYTVDDFESVPNSLWFGLSDIEPETKVVPAPGRTIKRETEPGFAFAVGVALFGYPAGYKDMPYTVRFDVPSGWKLGVALDPAGAPNTFKADDYDELVDAPVQMGSFEILEFTKGGKPHLITVTAPEALGEKDRTELVKVTDSIVGILTRFFGDMPYERYLFQHYLVSPKPGESMFGALEHANSSTYRMYYAPGHVAEVMAPIIAHEYWHLWSPKRFHVSELGPFDYQRAPRTESLWFHEGITEYYSHLLLIRNGLETPQSILADLSSAYNASNGKPQGTTITEVSRNIAEADPQQALALYSKGPIIGLMLDVEIRTQSNNKTSLDDAIKLFNREYAVGGKTFTDADIIPIIERATGTKLQDFYSRYINGKDPLPYDELLRRTGHRCEMRKEENPVLGAVLEQDDKGWKVLEVLPDGSAAAMGLKPGDILTKVSQMGQSLPLGDYPSIVSEQLYAQLPPTIMFGVMRNGEELSIRNKQVTTSIDICDIVVDPAATGLPLAVRQGLFEGK